MYYDDFLDGFPSRYGGYRHEYKPKLHHLTELTAESQDKAIDAWAERHKITDKPTIEAARSLAEGRHADVRYFVADPGDISGGSIQSAVVMYYKDRYESEARYHMALVFRDGRMALTTATYKRKESDYKKENITPEIAAARCKRLLEEAIGAHHEKKFELRSDSKDLKFPDRPDPYARRDHWAPSWYLPADLKEVTWIEGTPFWEKDDAFHQNFEQHWGTEIYGAAEDNPRLKKLGEVPGKWEHSPASADLRDTIEAHEKNRFQEAWSIFEARLDPKVLNACEKTAGIMSAQCYNWMAGDGNSYRSGRRIQAAETYSLFIRNLPFKEVTEAIDQEKPLKPVLAKHAGANHEIDGLPKKLKEATVQRLASQFKAEDIMSFPNDSTWRENWARLDALPPEWWPKKEDLAAYSALVEASEKYKETFEMPRMKILQEFRGDWQNACAKLRDDPGQQVGDTPSFYRTPMEVEDYLKALHRKLHLPILLQQAEKQKVDVEDWWFEKSPYLESEKERILSGIFNDVSLVKRVDLSRTWHQKYDELQAKMAEIGVAVGDGKGGSGLSWHPVTAPQAAPNGIQLVPLTNEEELRQEGSTLHHCVGGYGAECYKGDSQIISLRSATGEHISTLQIRISGEHVYQVQHHADHDAAPCEASNEAARWYMDQINGKKIQTNISRIQYTQSLSETVKAAAQIVGYNPYDVEACRKAFEVYKPCLPKRYRGMDYDTWLKETKVVEKAAKFVKSRKGEKARLEKLKQQQPK